jgi:hypothetical protein
MWWNAVAGASMGWINGQYAKVQTKWDNFFSNLNADSANRIRDSKNELTAAKGNLARWAQFVNNNNILKAGGKNLEANLVNHAREQDAMLSGNFEDSLRYAEQAGMQAASAGAAGVSGSTVDAINAATALRNSRNAQMRSDFADMSNFDTSQRARSIMDSMVGSMDQSIILDGLDYNKSVAQIAPEFSTIAQMLRGAAAGMGQDVDKIAGARTQSKDSPEYGGSGISSGGGSSGNYQIGSYDYSLARSGRVEYKPYEETEGHNYSSPQYGLTQDRVERFSFSLGDSSSNGYRLGGE